MLVRKARRGSFKPGAKYAFRVPDPKTGKYRYIPQPPAQKAYNGLFVACFLPAQAAKRLSITNGTAPQDMHITLAYLGKATTASLETANTILQEVRKLAEQTDPLYVTTGDVQRFTEGATNAVYVEADSDVLRRFRETLLMTLRGAGIEQQSEHETFVPHITLTYVPANEPNPIEELPRIVIPLNTVTVVAGPARRVIPLGNPQDQSLLAGMSKSLRLADTFLMSKTHPKRATKLILKSRGRKPGSHNKEHKYTRVEGVPGHYVYFYDQIQNHLSPDLLKPEFKNKPNAHPQAGHCYVASEALYHMLGGKASGLTPQNVQHEGVSHWFLKDENGNILDPTEEQFKTPVPYDKARGRGFLTAQPSKRAQTLMSRIRAGVPDWAHDLLDLKQARRDAYDREDAHKQLLRDQGNETDALFHEDELLQEPEPHDWRSTKNADDLYRQFNIKDMRFRMYGLPREKITAPEQHAEIEGLLHAINKVYPVDGKGKLSIQIDGPLWPAGHAWYEPQTLTLHIGGDQHAKNRNFYQAYGEFLDHQFLSKLLDKPFPVKEADGKQYQYSGWTYSQKHRKDWTDTHGTSEALHMFESTIKGHPEQQDSDDEEYNAKLERLAKKSPKIQAAVAFAQGVATHQKVQEYISSKDSEVGYAPIEGAGLQHTDNMDGFYHGGGIGPVFGRLMDTYRNAGMLGKQKVAVPSGFAGIPEFPNAKAATKWFKKQYPNIHFDFRNASMDVLQPTLRQLARLYHDWPIVAQNQEEVVVKDLNEPNVMARGSDKVIWLNSDYYEGGKLSQEMRRAANSRFHPAGSELAEATLTHEFGHSLHYNYLFRSGGQQFNDYTLTGNDDWWGIPYKAIQAWTTVTKPDRREISTYACYSDYEHFAEAFALMYHANPKKWPQSVHKLKAVLDATNPKKWRNLSGAPNKVMTVYDMPPKTMSYTQMDAYRKGQQKQQQKLGLHDAAQKKAKDAFSKMMGTFHSSPYTHLTSGGNETTFWIDGSGNGMFFTAEVKRRDAKPETRAIKVDFKDISNTTVDKVKEEVAHKLQTVLPELVGNDAIRFTIESKIQRWYDFAIQQHTGGY